VSYVIAADYEGRKAFRARAAKALRALADQVDASHHMIRADLSNGLNKVARLACIAEDRTRKRIRAHWIATGETPAVPADFDVVASDSKRDSVIQERYRWARAVAGNGGYSELDDIDREMLARELRAFASRIDV
jgi:hypothetical protein